MNSPISLVTLPDDSNSEVIGLLKRLLEKAEKGEVLSVAFCGVLNEGRIYHSVAGEVDIASLLGASVLMQQMIAKSIDIQYE